MPILKIYIDGEEVEFRIVPLNKNIMDNILLRYSDSDGIIDRPGFLSHVIKAPKMTRKEWGNIPSSMITKIIRNINYYIKSVDYKEKELRMTYMQINVFEEELDDLFRYLSDDSDDWAWEQIKKIESHLEELKTKKRNIEHSLEYVKSDVVIFEEGKEIDYDVQSLQLEN